MRRNAKAWLKALQKSGKITNGNSESKLVDGTVGRICNGRG